MRKQKLQPELRFPNFRNELQSEIFSSICEIKTGDKDTKDKIEDGKYPFYVRSNTVERINSYSYDGEAILTSGDGVGVGKNFHYINGKFDFHQRVYSLRNFSENIDGKFVYYYFSKKFYRRAIKMSAKNSVDSVRMDMIAKMEINLPSLAEQKKISYFLSEVDSLISNLTKQKEKLEEYKKGVMQKIFSQEIRFKDKNGKGFDDWKEYKIDEIAKVVGGGTPSTSTNKFWNGDINWYTPAEINKRILGPSKRKITEAGLQKSSAKILPKGALLLTTRANVGNCAIAQHECCTNQGFQSLIVSSKHDNKFVYYWIKFHKKELLRRAHGSTFLEISNSEVKKVNGLFPSIFEQKRISSFLENIDVKIELTDTKLQMMHDWKKGLLQKMFV